MRTRRFIRILLWTAGLALGRCLAESAAASTSATNTVPPSASGEYLFRQWTSDDGLPQNSVIGIAQTRDGYLWLSTFGGLARFDGVQFEVFDTQRVPALSRFHLTLSADTENGLWLSQSEEVVVHGQGGRFHRLGDGDGLPGGKGSRVSVGPDGTVWAGLPDGRLMRRESGRFMEFAPPPRPDWGSLWQLGFDAQGRIWTEQGGEFAVLEGRRWNRLPATGKGRTTSSMLPLADGSMLIQSATAPKTLLRYADGKLEPHLDLPGDRHQGIALFRQRDGTIWALNLGPLWRHRKDEGWRSVGESTPLANSVHRRAFEDREGNLWIGTDGAGLFQLRPRAVRSVGTAEGLTRPVVLSVSVAADGEVLAAVHGRGLQRFDGRRFRQDVRGPVFNEVQLAWCVWARPDGGAWVGTYGLGLFDLPRTGPAQVSIATGTPGLVEGPLGGLLLDPQGQLWIGGDRGLSRRSPDGTFRLWNRSTGLVDEEIGAIEGDGQGGAWIGTDHGLHHVTTDGIRNYTTADGLAHDIVRSLHRLADGTLWIGGAGLTRLRDGRFRPVPQEAGIPKVTIKSLVTDDVGSLWWGTARGVFRSSLRELDDFCEGRSTQVAVERLHRADGMPSNECSGAQPAAWKGPDGRLWFATLNGLAIIDPKHLPRNPLPPPVEIESVRVDGRMLEPVSGRVEIPPGPWVTEFRFTALSLVDPAGNRFRCRLDGLEESDRDMGTTRTVSYTRLGPGDYTLRVTAANNDGVWNATGAVLSVVVRPFFWQTWWFRLTAGLGSVGIIAAVVRWLSQRRLLRQVAALERDQAVNQERARIARNMHDDVGASLTQIGLLSDLARRQLSDRMATEARLDELGELSREVVRNLDAMVWTVDPGHDSMSSLVEYVTAYAQDYVRSAGLSFRLDLPAELPGDAVPAATRHHVLMLVKEALNNALKHARGTEITLRAAVDADTLRLEILDNGRGFDTGSAGRFADGLGNMRERAHLAGGRCSITSAPGAGTRVSLELPRLP